MPFVQGDNAKYAKQYIRYGPELCQNISEKPNAHLALLHIWHCEWNCVMSYYAEYTSDVETCQQSY